MKILALSILMTAGVLTIDKVTSDAMIAASVAGPATGIDVPSGKLLSVEPSEYGPDSALAYAVTSDDETIGVFYLDGTPYDCGYFFSILNLDVIRSQLP